MLGVYYNDEYWKEFRDIESLNTTANESSLHPTIESHKKRGQCILKALNKLILLCIITGILIMPCSGYAEASSWAISSLEEARTLDIIPDNLDQNYQQPITRAEFAQVAMYFCAAQYNVDPMTFVDEYRATHTSNGETEMPIDWGIFSDVRLGETDNIWPIYAAAFGIVAGCGDGTFNPDGLITRQEAAVMLESTYMLYSGTDIETNKEHRFADNTQIANWATDSVKKITSAGVMAGIGDNKFAPNEPYTREQCYVTFMALYKNMPISKYHRNVSGLFTPEDYVTYLSQGRMTHFSVNETLSCDSAFIIYGTAMSMSSSESRLIVVYRNGLGGHYAKGFSFRVSPMQSAAFNLSNFDWNSEKTKLSFCATPTENDFDQGSLQKVHYSLDILTGHLDLLE